MSASREKKKRHDVMATNGGVDPKTAREAEQRAAEKKSNLLYTGIAVAFVVVFAGLIVYNSGIVQRSRTAVSIDGEKYNAADVSYYYSNAYQNFMSNGYGSYFIDTSTPLSSQSYLGDESMTWADYFKEEAVSTLKLVHAACNAAKEENLALDEEDQASIESNIAAVKETAEANGYTYENYLKAVFGSLMTPDDYEENLERSTLASKYTQNHYDNISFTEDEITAYYEENKNTYDLVDGGYVTISGVAETKTDDEGNTIEATDEEKAAALEKAKESADTLLATYHDSDATLEELAKIHEATYTGSKKLSYSAGTAMDWLFDESRTSGDSEVLFDEDASTYYVAVFNSRERDESPKYDVRHILITEDNLELADGAEAEEGAVLAKAEEILASWDGTEDGFAALAKEHTQDGNGEEGGLYESVSKGTMVSAFENWCYEDGRKSGDTGIVETSYGQHIMYFVGYEDGTENEYWYTACQNALINDAYSTWETELMESVTAETKSGMNSVA